MLKIAIQKSGRLYEDSLKLLKDCGLSIDDTYDSLKVNVKNFPAEIFFLRNSDIPGYINNGVADAAIIGENVLIEAESTALIIDKLDFSKCRLSIAIPKGIPYQNVHYLQGKKIATSYPKTVKKYLKQNGIDAHIHIISGSVEIAPNIGLADAICDLVSSGSTLFKNGLEEKDIILHSQAVFVANKESYTLKRQLIDTLSFRIKAVLKARKNKYILFNIPNDKIEAAAKILPGLKSPSVLPLLEDGWSSLHSVISENEFWTVLDELNKVGAEGILVLPIEKMVY